MISFKVGDTALDCGRQSLGMIYRLSVLNMETGMGSRSFTIKFPFTATNDKFFGFQRFSDAGDKTRNWNAECQFNGASLHYGKLVLFAVRDAYECYFYPSNTENERLTTIISELDELDEVVVLGATTEDVVTASQFPDHENGIAFPPMYAPEWYGGKNETFVGIVNQKGTPSSNYVNNGSGNYFALAPGLYLYHLIEKIAAYLGYNLSGDLLTDVRFRELVVEGNYSLDENTGTPYKAELSADSAKSDLFAPFFVDFNVVSGGAYIGSETYEAYLTGAPASTTKDRSYYTVQDDGDHRITVTQANIFNEYDPNSYFSQIMDITVYLKLWRDPASGDPVLAHVWEISGERKHLKTGSNVFADAWDPHEAPFVSGDKLYFELEVTYLDPSSGETHDGHIQMASLDLEIINVGTAAMNGFAKSFNKKDVAPSVEINKLLESVKQWCACMVRFNDTNKTIEFKTINKVILFDEPEDWTSKALSGAERDLTQEAHIEWKLGNQNNGADSYIVRSNQSEAPYKTITPVFGTLPTEYHDSNYIGFINQNVYVNPGAGRSVMFNKKYAERPTRFLRVREYDDVDDPNDYTKRYKQAGEGFGDDVAYFWRRVAPLLANAEVELIPLKLTEVDIQKLDFTTKKVINGVEYLLQELRVPYDPGRIGVCMGEFLKINV